MLIKGLTHDNNGVLNMVEKFRGKISAGYAPGEGPNKKNHPVAAGYFRILKEVTETKRIGGSEKPVMIKRWVLNEPIQKKLEKSLGSDMPRRIELVSFYKTPQEMWDSCLAMFSSTDGLQCKSHGEGTNARYLTFDADGNRKWVDREFDGVKGCPYEMCPDYIAKKCKPLGMMKCFPSIDLTPNPYRFETRSLNTIIGIESAFTKYWNLLNVAHAIKVREAGGSKDIKFDGFFGAKLYLVHRKTKSGGREVFVSDLLPTESFINEIMEPIKRGLDMKSRQSKLTGGDEKALSLLEMAESSLLEGTTVNDNVNEEDIPLAIEDQKDIAVNFNSDNDTESQGQPDDVHQKAAEMLLDDGNIKD